MSTKNDTNKAMVSDSKGRAVPKETSLFAKKDWTYLEGKDPQDTHYLFSRMQKRVLGEDSDLVLTPRQWMAALAMHRALQASPENRARDEFRGRSVESVLAGSNTLYERNVGRDGAELLSGVDTATAKEIVRATGTEDLVREAVEAHKNHEVPAEEPVEVVEMSKAETAEEAKPKPGPRRRRSPAKKDEVAETEVTAGA